MAIIIPSSKTKDNINLNLTNENLIETISYDVRDIPKPKSTIVGNTKITYTIKTDKVDEFGKYIYESCYNDPLYNPHTSTTKQELIGESLAKDKYYFVTTEITFPFAGEKIPDELINDVKLSINYKSHDPNQILPDKTGTEVISAYRVRGDDPINDLKNESNAYTGMVAFWIKDYNDESIRIKIYMYQHVHLLTETFYYDEADYSLVSYVINPETSKSLTYGNAEKEPDYSIPQNEFITTGLYIGDLPIDKKYNSPYVLDVVGSYEVFKGWKHDITVKFPYETDTSVELKLLAVLGLSTITLNIAQGTTEYKTTQYSLVASSSYEVITSILPVYTDNYLYKEVIPNYTKIPETILEEYKYGKQSVTLTCNIGEYKDENGDVLITTDDGMFYPVFDKNGNKYSVIPMRHHKNVDIPISTKLDENRSEIPREFEVYSVEINYENGYMTQSLKLLEKT